MYLTADQCRAMCRHGIHCTQWQPPDIGCETCCSCGTALEDAVSTYRDPADVRETTGRR